MFKQIGENIRILRNRNKLSQSDLGSYLNLSRQQIAHYEKGEKTIPLISVNSISNIFRIPIDYLIKLDLSQYSSKELDKLLNDTFKDDFNMTESMDAHKKSSSVEMLNNYVKNVVKEQLAPIEDLLQKVLVKIDLTDLKYELGEEIKKVNKVIGEKQSNQTF